MTANDPFSNVERYEDTHTGVEEKTKQKNSSVMDFGGETKCYSVSTNKAANTSYQYM